LSRLEIPDKFEAHCVRAGVWRVEGLDVERHYADGKVWWQVFRRRADEPEVFLGKRRTLTDAIYEIVAQYT
jgi:hypothetical protein